MPKIIRMNFQNTRAFAQSLDAQDKLSKYQSEFEFPKINGKKTIYFTGNSLGLMPKRAKNYIDDVMNDWANLAVEGHFYAEKPWWDYHERFSEPLAEIRSEEHTSELQSRPHLVCRLLLE